LEYINEKGGVKMEEKMTDQMKDSTVLSRHREVRFPRFPYEEYEGRVSKARELMGKYGMDALLLFAPEDIFYYTGFKKENLAVEKRWRRGVVFPKKGEIVMLMGNEVFFNATITSWVKDIRGWGGPPELGRPQNFVEGYVGLIKEMDLQNKVLGVELWEKTPAVDVDLTWHEFDAIRRALPEAKFVDAGSMIWEQRMIKTPFEIGVIKELAKIATKGFRVGLETIREGVTEQEIVIKMYQTMLAEGLWDVPMFSRVPMKGPGHYHAGILAPQATVLKKGDMLMFDGGPRHKGYWCDIQRNACIGEPPAIQRKLYDAALEGLDAALSVIKPGVRVAEIHRAAAERLGKIDPKFSVIRNVFAGHGLGLHTHEPPYLDPTGDQADIILKEGMYLAVEISAQDVPEFRVVGGFPEDNVLVTKDGHENLTWDVPRKLWIAK
jgi:Xaa-Pro aminopeptidase